MRASMIVYSAIFGSLAAAITFLKLEIPFPILPYLKFDFAEIVDVLAFLIFGPVVGLFATTIHWLILNFNTNWPIIGPLTKYAAVLSMVLGFWGGSEIYKRLASLSVRNLMIIMFILGSLVRVFIMSLANIIVIYFIYGQPFFQYANFLLNKVLGWSLQNNLTVMIWILIFTSIYNIIHVIISILPAYSMLRYITPVFTNIQKSNVWIYNVGVERKNVKHG